MYRRCEKMNTFTLEEGKLTIVTQKFLTNFQHLTNIKYQFFTMKYHYIYGLPNSIISYALLLTLCWPYNHEINFI